MKRINILLLITIGILILVGCSKDNKSLISGTWVAVQASQAENSDEELGHYTILNITSSDIGFSTSNIQVGNDMSVEVNKNDEKKLKYEWISKDQLKIGDKIYDIELSKQEMTLKNENIEIHYSRDVEQ